MIKTPNQDTFIQPTISSTYNQSLFSLDCSSSKTITLSNLSWILLQHNFVRILLQNP